MSLFWYRHPLTDLVFDVVAGAIRKIYFPELFPEQLTALEEGLDKTIKEQFDEYFAGNRKVFDLCYNISGSPFQKEVLTELALVAYGTHISYADLAERVNRPQAMRAVGMVMKHNPLPILLPCHRIVGRNGALTGYAGGLALKEKLIYLEMRHIS